MRNSPFSIRPISCTQVNCVGDGLGVMVNVGLGEKLGKKLGEGVFEGSTVAIGETGTYLVSVGSGVVGVAWGLKIPAPQAAQTQAMRRIGRNILNLNTGFTCDHHNLLGWTLQSWNYNFLHKKNSTPITWHGKVIFLDIKAELTKDVENPS